jgi:hypothetical protein
MLSTVSLAAGSGVAAAAEPPELGGRWEGPLAMPLVAIHAALLPTGDVLVYSSGASARLLHWADWTFTAVPTEENIFCSGHSLPGSQGRRSST